ncbi:MAG TPA: hypothetical protein VKP30_15445, partial [Polyangiaceae bacterium]|nr:hypothetical protein [Polyangiaceae bacterium]
MPLLVAVPLVRQRHTSSRRTKPKTAIAPNATASRLNYTNRRKRDIIASHLQPSVLASRGHHRHRAALTQNSNRRKRDVVAETAVTANAIDQLGAARSTAAQCVVEIFVRCGDPRGVVVALNGLT